MDGYLKQHDAGGKVGYLSGSFTCDVSQHHIERNRSGPFMPTLAKSSVLVNLSAPPEDCSQVNGHIFTPNELNFSQGWPSIGFPGNQKYQKCVGHDLSHLSCSAQQDLMGNGIHLPAFAAWALYVSSNVVRRDLLQKLPPPLSFKRDPMHEIFLIGCDTQSPEQLALDSGSPLRLEESSSSIAAVPSPTPKPTLPTPDTVDPAEFVEAASGVMAAHDTSD